MQQQTQQHEQVKTTPVKSTSGKTATKKTKSKKQTKSTAAASVVQESAPVQVVQEETTVATPVVKTASTATKKVAFIKAPKKTRTPFNCYTVEKYPIQKKLDSALSFGKILAVIAQDWKKLSDSEKEPYTVLSNTDRERYTSEMETYQSQPDEMKQTGKKTKVKYSGPKRTQSMYMLYKHDASAEIKAATPDISFGDLQKEVGVRWTNLKKVDTTATTKLFEKYQKLHTVDKARYEKEFAEHSKVVASTVS